MTTTAVRPTRARRAVLISAAAVPVLILGQFAMLAIVPVAIAVIAGARMKGVRLFTWMLGALYVTPLIIWALRENPARSLSRDIDPIFAALIIAGAIAVLIAIVRSNRKA